MGLDIPWIRVTEALEKAMPACVAAAIKDSRAALAEEASAEAGWPPGRTAYIQTMRRAEGIALIAASACKSAKALALRET
mmetsp:Transcript_2043/g.5581  ORF Transcript_2043/g.5581 Transcript_2043/m.5581 type:complete len:80 (+) Transcript_2043:568-807(+)